MNDSAGARGLLMAAVVLWVDDATARRESSPCGRYQALRTNVQDLRAIIDEAGTVGNGDSNYRFCPCWTTNACRDTSA